MADIEEQAGELLTAVSRFGRSLRARLGDRPTDRASFLLLHLLELHGPQRMTDLAAQLSLDHSTVSRQVGALSEAGLVETHPDPHDGRARRLVVTDAGRKHAAETRSQVAAVVAAAMRHGGVTDAEPALRLLDRVTDGLATARPPTPHRPPEDLR